MSLPVPGVARRASLISTELVASEPSCGRDPPWSTWQGASGLVTNLFRRVVDLPEEQGKVEEDGDGLPILRRRRYTLRRSLGNLRRPRLPAATMDRYQSQAYLVTGPLRMSVWRLTLALEQVTSTGKEPDPDVSKRKRLGETDCAGTNLSSGLS